MMKTTKKTNKTREEIREQKKEFDEKVKELIKSNPTEYGGFTGHGQAKVDVASTYKNPDKYIQKYAKRGKAAIIGGNLGVALMGVSAVALIAAHDIAALAGYASKLIFIW